MQIGETTTTWVPLAQQRVENSQQLQNVFSAMLQSVGREGYESAEAIESSEPLGQQMQSSWDGWFELERNRRYQDVEQPVQLAKDFGH